MRVIHYSNFRAVCLILYTREFFATTYWLTNFNQNGTCKFSNASHEKPSFWPFQIPKNLGYIRQYPLKCVQYTFLQLCHTRPIWDWPNETATIFIHRKPFAIRVNHSMIISFMGDKNCNVDADRASNSSNMSRYNISEFLTPKSAFLADIFRIATLLFFESVSLVRKMSFEASADCEMALFLKCRWLSNYSIRRKNQYLEQAYCVNVFSASRLLPSSSSKSLIIHYNGDHFDLPSLSLYGPH